ncbi:MAG: hypothetical protein M3Y41_04600 [Pseudomonadota bacterium]|nr:hypothetical protein [Pseudomonadota bacterium]
MERKFNALFHANDVSKLEAAAKLRLTGGISPEDVASRLSVVFESAIGELLALGQGGGANYADVREWLDKVAKEAAALLQRLGFDPASYEAMEKNKITMFDSARILKPYMLHLQTASAASAPPILTKSPAFERWLKPERGSKPLDATLCAVPEVLAVLMIQARRSGADYAKGAGRIQDQFRKQLFQDLAEAHYAIFGRKPITRNTSRDRGGSGPVWARLICEIATERVRAVADADAQAISTVFARLATTPAATLADHLDEGWKACQTAEG